jgi:ribosomal protein S18 acetylase RimI-like enzyme
MRSVIMKIRPATPEDAAAIARVHITSWQRAYERILPAEFLAGLSFEGRRDVWAESIASGQPQVLVAEVDSQVVGFCAVGPCRDDHAPVTTFEVWAIYLSPSHWSAGLGRELWLASRNWALAHGATDMSLWVITTNQRAISFYEAAGFEVARSSLKSSALGGVQVEEVRYSQQIARWPAASAFNSCGSVNTR